MKRKFKLFFGFILLAFSFIFVNSDVLAFVGNDRSPNISTELNLFQFDVNSMGYLTYGVFDDSHQEFYYTDDVNGHYGYHYRRYVGYDSWSAGFRAYGGDPRFYINGMYDSNGGTDGDTTSILFRFSGNSNYTLYFYDIINSINTYGGSNVQITIRLLDSEGNFKSNIASYPYWYFTNIAGYRAFSLQNVDSTFDIVEVVVDSVLNYSHGVPYGFYGELSFKVAVINSNIDFESIDVPSHIFYHKTNDDFYSIEHEQLIGSRTYWSPTFNDTDFTIATPYNRPIQMITARYPSGNLNDVEFIAFYDLEFEYGTDYGNVPVYNIKREGVIGDPYTEDVFWVLDQNPNYSRSSGYDIISFGNFKHTVDSDFEDKLFFTNVRSLSSLNDSQLYWSDYDDMFQFNYNQIYSNGSHDKIVFDAYDRLASSGITSQIYFTIMLIRGEFAPNDYPPTDPSDTGDDLIPFYDVLYYTSNMVDPNDELFNSVLFKIQRIPQTNIKVPFAKVPDESINLMNELLFDYHGALSYVEFSHYEIIGGQFDGLIYDFDNMDGVFYANSYGRDVEDTPELHLHAIFNIKRYPVVHLMLYTEGGTIINVASDPMYPDSYYVQNPYTTQLINDVIPLHRLNYTLKELTGMFSYEIPHHYEIPYNHYVLFDNLVVVVGGSTPNINLEYDTVDTINLTNYMSEIGDNIYTLTLIADFGIYEHNKVWFHFVGYNLVSEMYTEYSIVLVYILADDAVFTDYWSADLAYPDINMHDRYYPFSRDPSLSVNHHQFVSLIIHNLTGSFEPDETLLKFLPLSSDPSKRIGFKNRGEYTNYLDVYLSVKLLPLNSSNDSGGVKPPINNVPDKLIFGTGINSFLATFFDLLGMNNKSGFIIVFVILVISIIFISVYYKLNILFSIISIIILLILFVFLNLLPVHITIITGLTLIVATVLLFKGGGNL